MKLAISGNSGVGKTTLAALMAQVYADQGRDVLAADGDPAPLFGGGVGVTGRVMTQKSGASML